MQPGSGQPERGREREGELRELAARRVVADLVERRERGQLRAEEVRMNASRLGVGERTLWRWIAAGRLPERRRRSSRRLDLSADLREAYLRLGGNVAAVWREQRVARGQPPPFRTLQQAFARELRPAERASAKRGEAGRRQHGLYLRCKAPHRNAVWQADPKQLPVLVVGPRGGQGRRPWVEGHAGVGDRQPRSALDRFRVAIVEGAAPPRAVP